MTIVADGAAVARGAEQGWNDASIPAFPRLRAVVQPPLAAFLASRAVCFLAGYLALVVTPPYHPNVPGAGPENLWLSWTVRWDSGWYESIVAHGYSFSPGQQCNVGFFPLYPLVIWFVSRFLKSSVLAALVVDHLAFLGALIYLHALARKVLPDRDSAERSVWLVALFPTSFYCSAYYTESLFLFLSVGAFFHLHCRQWGRAVVLAGLASACRAPGMFLSGVLLLEWMKDGGWALTGVLRGEPWLKLAEAVRRRWRLLLLIPCSVLGLALYMAFLYVKFGRLLAFLEVQGHWDRHWRGPWAVVSEGVTRFCNHDFLRGTDGNNQLDFFTDFNLLCLLAGLVLCVSVWRNLGESYACYCVISLLVPASMMLESIGRYSLVLFPLFLVLSLHLRRPALERAVLAVFTALLVAFTALFAVGRYIV